MILIVVGMLYIRIVIGLSMEFPFWMTKHECWVASTNHEWLVINTRNFNAQPNNFTETRAKVFKLNPNFDQCIFACIVISAWSIIILNYEQPLFWQFGGQIVYGYFLIRFFFIFEVGVFLQKFFMILNFSGYIQMEI